MSGNESWARLAGERGLGCPEAPGLNASRRSGRRRAAGLGRPGLLRRPSVPALSTSDLPCTPLSKRPRTPSLHSASCAPPVSPCRCPCRLLSSPRCPPPFPCAYALPSSSASSFPLPSLRAETPPYHAPAPSPLTGLLTVAHSSPLPVSCLMSPLRVGAGCGAPQNRTSGGGPLGHPPCDRSGL